MLLQVPFISEKSERDKSSNVTLFFYDALFKSTQPSIDFYVVISTLAKYEFLIYEVSWSG